MTSMLHRPRRPGPVRGAAPAGAARLRMQLGGGGAVAGGELRGARRGLGHGRPTRRRPAGGRSGSSRGPRGRRARRTRRSTPSRPTRPGDDRRGVDLALGEQVQRVAELERRVADHEAQVDLLVDRHRRADAVGAHADADHDHAGEQRRAGDDLRRSPRARRRTRRSPGPSASRRRPSRPRARRATTAAAARRSFSIVPTASVERRRAPCRGGRASPAAAYGELLRGVDDDVGAARGAPARGGRARSRWR